jgi:hypothetical protein
MAITRRVWFGKIYVMIYLENIENRAGKITPNELFYFNINVSGLKSGRSQMLLRKNYREFLATLVYDVWKVNHHAL